MYPKVYVDHFRDFERSEEVFVAMPFGDAFESRWKSIFSPAIQSVHLRPYRVDKEVASDSILTDILQGIGQAKLVLVDISDEKGNKPNAVDTSVGEADKPKPNANVMYELGLAHAIRLPEEVVVVRDDEKRAPFNLLHIRAHRFDPSNSDGSRDVIAKLLDGAMKEVDLTRDLIVKKVRRALNRSMVLVMVTNRSHGIPIIEPFGQGGGYMGLELSEVRTTFSKLVEAGVFEAVPVSVGDVHYRWTKLGRVVADSLGI